MTPSSKMPSLFIAHGAPLLAIQQNEYTDFLNGLPRMLPSRPKAIVLFSAHWEQPVQQISRVNGTYETIYDFGGFPPEMYEMQYPAVDVPVMAERIHTLLKEQGVDAAFDEQRGLDHGAWVVLRLMYPEADIPVVAMSVNPGLTPEQQYAVGRALEALRSEEMLMIASGGTVHNLRRINWQGGTESWAVEFDDWLANRLQQWDLEQLFRYEELAPHASDAVPPYGREHFIPLFYAMGAADSARQASLLHRSYQYGSLSHSVWRFGV
ncbi:DODA-type extradiol aromatic ring-opening family dioxygenase [Paenibacillus turpanensis]|uniref:DODA-type extradiol aromatic ring-opening family dioxygenase n=1 Tax=Paenibacillus turpanensis TaxID=2689078 RepID=UPI001FB698F5|nr:class III extradiol ring-cleavage dioxygenase [Paenibacillus turpanensis]